MTTVNFGEMRIEVEDGETVLRAMERAGCEVPSSCRAGVCQSCLMRAVDGEPPEGAQRGIRAPLRALGAFLPCVCVPNEDLVVRRAGIGPQTVPARIISRTHFTPTVAAIELRLLGEFDARGGQFLNLVRSDGLTRAYSIANLPDRTGTVRLHVRRVEGGRMSTWLHEADIIGGKVKVRGPAGECVYPSEGAHRPLLLVGTGTGLAPLVGILREALRQGHDAPITLVHGAKNPERLYLTERLRSIAAENPHIGFHPCASTSDGGDPQIRVGSLVDVVADVCPNPTDHLAYVCGRPETVKRVKQSIFLAGASSRDIFSDPFIRAEPAEREGC